MADKRLVTVCTASRSEKHLVAPIIKRIAESPRLELDLLSLDPTLPFHEIVRLAESHLGEYEPSIVLIPTDRREMVPVAMVSFFLNIPTFHFLGGTYSYSMTHDDVSRHVISMFSHIVFVESEKARELLVSAGEEPWRVKTVGTTHFDDVDIDESLCPREPYDLLLMNPLPLSLWRTNMDVKTALRMLGAVSVLIGPNEDPYGHLVKERLTKYREKHPASTLYLNGLPRHQFLGLLKNCRRFISNSSSGLYEAPYFNIPVVNPSMRNSERTPPQKDMLKGAADKVVRELENIELNEMLLAKRYRSGAWLSTRLRESQIAV